jgi:type I restriction enzyme, S subunit
LVVNAAPLRLGDVVTLQRGTTYKSALLGKSGPVLLGLASIQRNGGFRDDNLKTYGGDSPEKLTLHPGDIYVSLKDVTQSADLLGAVARVPPHITAGRVTQDTVKLSFVRKDIPSRYVYWLLRTPVYREYCRSHAIGTTNLSIARDDFLSFPVPIPTARELTLVETLDALDDKIDLNRRMNATLEAMARVLFQSWFVDFHPVRGKLDGCLPATLDLATASLFPRSFQDSELGHIPKGWTAGRLGDIGTNSRRSVQPTEISPNTPYIALEHMPRRCIALSDWVDSADVSSGKSAFRKGEVLFGKLRPYFHKVGVAPLDGVCSTDILVLAPKSPEWFGFLVGHVSSDELIQFTDLASTGTKMPRTNWSDISSFKVALPPKSIAVAFTNSIRPLLDRIHANIHQSRTLSAARDALLPRLMTRSLRTTHLYDARSN